MKPTHQVTIVEPVNMAEEMKKSLHSKNEELELLDWSLSLLIQSTNFGYEQLKKQLEQAKRLGCVGTEEEIMEVINERYAFSWENDKKDSKGDTSGGSLGSDNR